MLTLDHTRISEGAPAIAAEYMKLAKDCFALAKATLSPDTKEAFLEAGREYLAKAKVLDPNLADAKFEG